MYPFALRHETSLRPFGALVRHPPARIALIAIAACVACVAAPASTPKAVDGIRTLADTVYYPVHGTTPREWATSSRAEAARAGVRVPAIAMLGFANRWVYTAQHSEYGCEPHDPAVILGIRFVMPRLASDTGVTREDMTAWEGLMRTLWVHEKAHATIARKSAVEFRDSLRVLHSGECGVLMAHVSAVAKEVQQRYEALQVELDDRRQRGSRPAGQIDAFRGTFLGVDTTFRDSVPNP